MAQVINQAAAARDEAAYRGKGLAQHPHQYVHAAVRLEMGSGPTAARSHDSHSVRIVQKQQRTIAGTELGDAVDRRQVSSHRVDAVYEHQLATPFRSLQQRFKVIEIVERKRYISARDSCTPSMMQAWTSASQMATSWRPISAGMTPMLAR